MVFPAFLSALCTLQYSSPHNAFNHKSKKKIHTAHTTQNFYAPIQLFPFLKSISPWWRFPSRWSGAPRSGGSSDGRPTVGSRGRKETSGMWNSSCSYCCLHVEIRSPWHARSSSAIASSSPCLRDQRHSVIVQIYGWCT